MKKLPLIRKNRMYRVSYISIKYIHNTPPDENQKLSITLPPCIFFFTTTSLPKIIPQDLMYNMPCNVV